MVRKLVGRAVGLMAVPVLMLTACGPGSTDGAASAPTVEPEAAGANPAAAGVPVPCTPGSGRAFSGTSPMNLTDLSGQALDCAVFDNQTMNSVRLSDAKLSGARFTSSTVNKVDFSRATLVGAVFSDSTLNNADFTGANLSGADLRDANMNGVIFTGATCPDGATAGGDGCGAHLTPVAVETGTAAPETPAETTADTPADTSTDTPQPGKPVPPVKPGKPGVQDAPAMFNGTANGTYRCTGGNVVINGASSDVHLTGSCASVFVNGASSEVEIDAAARILVNGAHASVIYHAQSHVFVNGVGASAHRG